MDFFPTSTLFLIFYCVTPAAAHHAGEHWSAPNPAELPSAVVLQLEPIASCDPQLDVQTSQSYMPEPHPAHNRSDNNHPVSSAHQNRPK